MLLAYVDEAYDKDTYFINTLLVQDRQLICLGKSLNDLRLDIANEYGLPENIEFHGYDILNGVNDWRPLKADYDSQIRVFTEIVDCVLDHDVGIYIKGIRIQNFTASYGTDQTILHNAALIWNLEKIQSKAKQLDETVLVIADEVSDEGSTLYRSSLRQFQASQTFGWAPSILDRIADTIHFAPSKESSLIQAVDIIAHANIRARRKDGHPRLRAFQNGLRNSVNEGRRTMYYNIW